MTGKPERSRHGGSIEFGELQSLAELSQSVVDLGLEPHQVVGVSLYERFDTADEEHPVIAAHREALAGKAVGFDQQYGDRVFASHCEAMRNASGTVVGTVGLALDITERKRALDAVATERERLEVTLRSIHDGVIAADTRKRVQLVNPAAEQMTGWPMAEAVGQPLERVFYMGLDRALSAIQTLMDRAQPDPGGVHRLRYAKSPRRPHDRAKPRARIRERSRPFYIVDEDTRQPATDPLERVLKRGETRGDVHSTRSSST